MLCFGVASMYETMKSPWDAGDVSVLYIMMILIGDSGSKSVFVGPLHISPCVIALVVCCVGLLLFDRSLT